MIPDDSPSRDILFPCRPAAAEELPCVRQIVSTLARRAYRRPVTEEDVQTLIGFYTRARSAGNFEEGIRSALERILVSPDFLFRIESDPAGVAPGAVYRIPDIELASRWSVA
jgi:hypothetical protein